MSTHNIGFDEEISKIIKYSSINMSRVTIKPDFCLCENKGADQLHSNCEADQRLCFPCTDSSTPLLFKSKISFCDCTDWFASRLVGNPEDLFSRAAAHIVFDEYGTI